MSKSDVRFMIGAWVVFGAMAVALSGCGPDASAWASPKTASPATRKPAAKSAAKTAPQPAAQPAAPKTAAAKPASSPEAPQDKTAATTKLADVIRHGKSVCVVLGPEFNNDAIGSEANPQDGNFDVPDAEFGDTYPWTGLPKGGEPFTPEKLKGVTFLFPDYADGKKNNMACKAQTIRIKPANYRTLYILGASEEYSQESELTLLTEKGGMKQVPFKLTDWCMPVKYGEIPVLKWDHRIDPNGQRDETSCQMYVVTIPLERGTRFHGLRLPQNPRMHIFALTLQE